VRNSLLQRVEVEISLGGNPRGDDARCEGAHETRSPKRAPRIVWAEVRLDTETRHVYRACSAKEQRQPRADHRIGPGHPERLVNPVTDCRDKLHGRLSAHGTAIKVDRKYKAIRAHGRQVMSKDLTSVGKVKEDQATDDRIERRSVPKCPHVGLRERDVIEAGSEPAMLGNLEQPRALIDAYDPALLPDKLRYVKRDVAEACADI
jgi:hypothetical protein